MSRSDLRAVWTLLGPRKGAAALVFALMLAEAVFDCLGLGMVVPLLASVQGSAPEGPLTGRLLGILPAGGRVPFIAAALVALFTMKNVVRFAGARYRSVLLWELRSDWWRKILENYLQLPYHRFVDTKQGVLLNDLLTEPGYCLKAFLNSLNFLSAAVLACAYYASLLAFSWRATLAITAGAGVVLFVVRRLGLPHAKRLADARQQHYHQITQQASEAVHGILQIKLHGMEKAFGARFKDSVDGLNLRIKSYETLRNLPGPALETSLVAALAVAFAILLEDGDPAGRLPFLVGVVLLSQRFFSQVSIMSGGNVEWVAMLPSVRKTAELIQPRADSEDTERGLPFPGLRREVELRNVSFSYPGKESCLRDVSLRLPVGSLTVVSGASGAGKSTLVSLLGGLDPRYEGAILADGVELRELRLSDWRSRLAYISQDNYLFAASVRDNLAVGKPDATASEIEAAARLAQADGFITHLPGGYDALIGDKGLTLSGGQRQRVVLARAILRGSDLYIFDEATNALDAQAEAALRSVIVALSREHGRTVLVVTHDRSWMDEADAAYVLEAGMLVPAGERSTAGGVR